MSDPSTPYPANPGAIRLGMLTPSSNTLLEPTTAAMLAGTPGVTAHFARFRVTRIALAPDAQAQFDHAPILAAATLLADAHTHAIAWNGTSAAWLGFDTDHRLCRAITAATGIPATSAVLALNDALAALGARTLGLVTPYTADVQARIAANYAAAGLPVVAERHLDDPGNYSFAQHDEATVAALVRDVARARPDAIAILCTNFRGARLAPALEAELGIPILDSIALTLWHTMQLAGADPRMVHGWGSVLSLTHVSPAP